MTKLKNMIKGVLKKMPGVKQYLARMQNLENKLKAEIDAARAELNEMKKQLDAERKHLNDMKSDVNDSFKAYDLRFNGKLKDLNSDLKSRIYQEVLSQKHSNDFFRSELQAVRADINYKYYKGLHKDSYEWALNEWFSSSMGYELDFENPVTYNQKLQWLKLYDNTPIKAMLSDKLKVREWIKEKLGEEYLIPLLGVWKRFEDIDFDKLPERFVLKANHGSGFNIVVKDKAELNMVLAQRKFNGWMNTNFAFKNGLELQYKYIKPLILAEKYMEELDRLYDYKFMCFGGRVEFIWVDVDRFVEHKRNLYTRDWVRINKEIDFPSADYEVEKPKCLNEMIEIAEKLSEGFAHVRVDLYEVEGKIYFGEMTFSSGSGRNVFKPGEFDRELGDLIKLPEKREDLII